MLVEMLLLVLIAATVFAFVLAPLVRPARHARSQSLEEEQTSVAPQEAKEPVAADSQPVRDTP